MNTPIPVSVYKGKCRKLYLYWDMGQILGWFPNLETFKKQVNAAKGVRVAQDGYDAPKGYRKTGRGLANEPAEAIPTVRDFVKALSPRRSLG